MAAGDGIAPGDDLGAARARVAELEEEVRRLRSRLDDERVADDLRARLAGVAAAGALGAPSERDELLEQIVRTAMHVLQARAGSLYLIDEASEELVFEVALGENAGSLRGQRFPVGRGIAGWVAATGQAIAVADAQQDQRWAKEIGQEIGYLPRTMLVIPLLLHDEVTGVLQLLDKEGERSFSAADMATLGLFAQQAAVAIAQSGAVRSLAALLRAEFGGAGGARLGERELAFLAGTERQAEYQDIVRLAGLLRRLVHQDAAGRRLGLTVMGGIVEYVEGRRRDGV